MSAFPRQNTFELINILSTIYQQRFPFFSQNFFSAKCSRRFALLILCPATSLCFHSVSRCDWFVVSSREFDENKQLDYESTSNFPLLDKRFP